MANLDRASWVMDPHPEPISFAQSALLKKLMLSSTFTEQEADRTMRWVSSAEATKVKASVLIEKAMARIQDRNERQKQSERRKSQYREGV